MPNAPRPAEGRVGENRQRVDEAFIEHAEDQIDADQRRQDQQRHGRQQVLERLGVALEGRGYRRGQAQLIDRRLDRHGRLAKRDAGSEIETDRDGRELALVADRQRLDRPSVVHLAKALIGTSCPVVGERM